MIPTEDDAPSPPPFGVLPVGAVVVLRYGSARWRIVERTTDGRYVVESANYGGRLVVGSGVVREVVSEPDGEAEVT